MPVRTIVRASDGTSKKMKKLEEVQAQGGTDDIHNVNQATIDEKHNDGKKSSLAKEADALIPDVPPECSYRNSQGKENFQEKKTEMKRTAGVARNQMSRM